MDQFNQALAKSLSPVKSGRTYLNIVYLLLLFPLGTASFTLVVTVLSIGAALIVSPITPPNGG